MFDFGEHADYMALGYALMGLLLGGMVFWMYVRYRVLQRDAEALDQLEAEERQERAASRSADETVPARSGVAASPAAPKET